MEDRILFTVASSCADLFAHSLDNVIQPKDISEEKALLHQEEFLDTQSGRFRIWAASIGVFADGNASLDHRLRESTTVKSLMLGQLQALQKYLQKVNEKKSSSEDDEVESESSASDDSDDDIESIPSLASDNGDTAEPTLSNGFYELQQIPEVISRLHRLTVAIRKTAGGTQNTKAAAYKELDDDGNDVFEMFEKKVALFLTKQKFPEAGDTLHLRLSQAMAFRRRRFRYRQRHQIKLSGPRYIVPQRKFLSARPASRAPSTQALGIFPHEPETYEARKASREESGSVFSATEASVFTESKFQENAVSSKASSAPSAAGSQSHRLNIPPPPRIPVGANEFICPHCCLVQPVSTAKPKRWRQHLLRDLEPYVCLVESCPDSGRLYRDRRTWFTHMRSHTMNYCCKIAHEPIVFKQEIDYDKHMQAVHHGLFTERQLATIKQHSGRLAPSPFESCPLCLWKPADGAHSQASSPNGEERSSYAFPATPYTLQDHIATHLQFLALYCLAPQDDADEDISSDQPSLRRAASSTMDESEASSITISVELENHDSSAALLVSEEYTEIFKDHIVPPDCEPQIYGDWEFLHQSRLPFIGLEVDPTLKNFRRRLKMETLLAAGKAVDPALPCHYQPLGRNRSFFGREEILHNLELILCPQKRAALAPLSTRQSISTVILQGLGGVGKTQIAAEFASKMTGSFDAILWVHADEPSKLANDINRLAIKLGLVSENSAEARDHLLTRDLLKAWLMNPVKNFEPSAKSEKATWLLIFDHVIVPDVVNDYWPIGGSTGSILITTRQVMPWSVHRYPVLLVKPFSAGEAAAFLSKLTDKERSNEEEKQGRIIGSRVDGFPHELTLLAKIIVRNQFSFAEFLQAYDEKHSQRAALKLNVQALGTASDGFFSGWCLDVLEESSSALLDVLSLLDADGVPERMLTAQPSFLYIAHYPDSRSSYEEARAELLSYGLVTWDKSSGNLLLHRLVQDAARRRMDAQRTRAVFNTCVKLLNVAWPYQRFTWRHSIQRWPACAELFTHVIRLQKFAKQIDTDMTDLSGAYEYAKLTTDAGWFCHERGRSLDSEVFCDIAQRICESLKKFYPLSYTIETDESPTEGQIDNILAEISHNRGCIAAEMNRRADALWHHTIFNDMMVKEYGDGHTGIDMRLAISWSQLGAAYMINDNWSKGEECFLKAIHVMKRVEDYEPFKISLPLVNLGLSWWLTGRHEDAVITLHEGLRHREKAFGRDDRESFITGRFYHALGNVKASQGLLEESFEFHRKAHDHYIKTLGRGHHRTADTGIKLADHHIQRGQVEIALQFLQQALKVYFAQDMYVPEKARALFMRSKAYAMLGQASESRLDGQESLKLYRVSKPEDTRPLEELTGSDFDEIVVFWSR